MNLWTLSTSALCGFVDGLPHDCHTETIAKRAEVGPRAQAHTPTIKMFWRMVSTSGLESPIIVLDYILKIWTEIS